MTEKGVAYNTSQTQNLDTLIKRTNIVEPECNEMDAKRFDGYWEREWAEFVAANLDV
jgi:hypothetical protein